MTKVNERSTVRLNVDTNESGEVVFHAATSPETPVVARELSSRLIKLAAAVIAGHDFISPYADDNPKTTPRAILDQAEKQREWLRLWAIEIRAIADKLSATIITRYLGATSEGDKVPSTQEQFQWTMNHLLYELTAYLDTLTITSDNIGDVRRSLFVPWESRWNGIVREQTADRELSPDATATTLPSETAVGGEAESGRQFPIHSTDRHLLKSVPWALVEAHRKQAHDNHDQSLERLAERGGLGLRELFAVLNNRSWHPLETLPSDEESLKWIKERVAEFAAPVPAADDDEGEQDYTYAVRLATILRDRFYTEVQDWQPLDTLSGVLSQIDNMIAGLPTKRMPGKTFRIEEPNGPF